MTDRLIDIELTSLIPDLNQPRKSFLAQDELDRLATSIRSRGVLQPLRVRWDPDLQKWKVVIGECRYHAAHLAGLRSVPCIPMESNPSDEEILLDQVVENTVRHALKPTELAASLSRLKTLKGWNSQELAAETGISGPAITRSEGLLKLSMETQALVDAGSLSESAAYEISRLPDEASQQAMVVQAIAGGLNRDQIADQVRDRVGRRHVQAKSSRLGLKLENLSITLSSGQPLGWKELIDTFDLLRREAKKLADAGKEVGALALVLRAR